MIKTIYIKDFAIFNEIDLSFKSGLTVITGETGSGKSILLQAIAVSLGEKINKVMVRSDCNKAIIETKIDNDYIRRIISKDGRSRCFRNDVPISIKKIENLKKTKVDFHNQHDQQLILDKNNQIDFLDKFLKIDDRINKISNLYNQLNKLKFEFNDIQNTINTVLEKLELLNFQAEEIDFIDPKIDEDIILDKKYKKIFNSKEIIKNLNNIENEISLNEYSVLNKLNELSNVIESILKYDSSYEEIYQLIKSSIINIQEASSDISIKLDNIEFDEIELAKIEDRLNSIETLKRKYGGSIDSIFHTRKKIDKEIKLLKNIESKEKTINNRIKEKQKEFSLMAIDIHNIRKIKSKKLSKLIKKNLNDLNMKNSEFEIKISNSESELGFVKLNDKLFNANEKGIDEVEYFLSANLGEPLKPLSLIASGGETSRIMLALKKVFQKFDPVDTLVFDEIDSGISGMAAEKFADQLVEISKFKQVICITHLPQITLKADHHLHILKSTKKNHTDIKMKYLNKLESKKLIKDLFYSSKLDKN